MANIVRIKRRAAGGAAGAPSSLQNAELAFNEQDDVLYYGKGTGGAGGSATQVIAIGGPGFAVQVGGTYNDPSFITSLAGSKISGNISGNAANVTGTVALANGGTGATTAAAARTNLGLVIGTNVQAWDADLDAIAALAGTSGLLKKTAANTWSLDTSAYLTGNQSITFSGDATGSGTTAVTLTLAASGVTAGTYRSVTVDAKGRVTAGTNPTTLSGYGITDAQPLDADLTAIAGLAGTSGLLKKTGADTWTLDTATYLTGITSGQVTTALGYTPENSANKGAANGYASLDATGKVPSAQLPSFVDDVLEYANLAAFPATGTAGVIYVALDTNRTYRWGGSVYVEIAASPGTTDSLTEGSVNLYFTQARARASISVSGSLSYNSSTGVLSFTDAVTSVAGKTGAVTLAKGDVGLGNVENTALSTWAGSANITTLGTISTGTWNATAIGVTKGGLGLTAAVTGLLKGNGTAYSAAVAGTDYLDPNSAIDGGTF